LAETVTQLSIQSKSERSREFVIFEITHLHTAPPIRLLITVLTLMDH